MRRFPHGVAVLTVDAEGERLGLTVGSLVSLSLEPPLVGLAISRQAAMHELLRAAGGFALSLLAQALERLRAEADGLPRVEAALDLLLGDANLAWRAFAAGVLGEELADTSL